MRTEHNMSTYESNAPFLSLICLLIVCLSYVCLLSFIFIFFFCLLLSATNSFYAFREWKLPIHAVLYSYCSSPIDSSMTNYRRKGDVANFNSFHIFKIWFILFPPTHIEYVFFFFVPVLLLFSFVIIVHVSVKAPDTAELSRAWLRFGLCIHTSMKRVTDSIMCVCV